jgi:hypothetical protein
MLLTKEMVLAKGSRIFASDLEWLEWDLGIAETEQGWEIPLSLAEIASEPIQRALGLV